MQVRRSRMSQGHRPRRSRSRSYIVLLAMLAVTNAVASHVPQRPWPTVPCGGPARARGARGAHAAHARAAHARAARAARARDARRLVPFTRRLGRLGPFHHRLHHVHRLHRGHSPGRHRSAGAVSTLYHAAHLLHTIRTIGHATARPLQHGQRGGRAMRWVLPKGTRARMPWDWCLKLVEAHHAAWCFARMKLSRLPQQGLPLQRRPRPRPRSPRTGRWWHPA